MTDQKKSLTAANIRYLLTIKELSIRYSDHIRSIDIANCLQITKPSVHTMAKALEAMGLINRDRYGMLRLTEEGTETATRYERFYEAGSRHLDSILPDCKNKKSVVCAMLAELSEEDCEAICRC